METQTAYFQDFMEGNICFGCGKNHPDGLQIKSRWEGEESICVWQAEAKYQGWKGLLNGGILASLIDCHCMCTAMAAAYRAENRDLKSEPAYRYATGTLNVRYEKPTPISAPLELRAQITEIKGIKISLLCQVFSGKTLTATAEVIALKVFDSSKDNSNNPFAE